MSRDKDNAKWNIYCSKYNQGTQNTQGIHVATNVKIQTFQGRRWFLFNAFTKGWCTLCEATRMNKYVTNFIILTVSGNNKHILHLLNITLFQSLVITVSN